MTVNNHDVLAFVERGRDDFDGVTAALTGLDEAERLQALSRAIGLLSVWAWNQQDAMTVLDEFPGTPEAAAMTDRQRLGWVIDWVRRTPLGYDGLRRAVDDLASRGLT